MNTSWSYNVRSRDPRNYYDIEKSIYHYMESRMLEADVAILFSIGKVMASCELLMENFDFIKDEKFSSSSEGLAEVVSSEGSINREGVELPFVLVMFKLHGKFADATEQRLIKLEHGFTQWCTEGGGGFQTSPTPKKKIPKALQNRAKLNPIVKTVKNY
jgi:hypothetical protein